MNNSRIWDKGLLSTGRMFPRSTPEDGIVQAKHQMKICKTKFCLSTEYSSSISRVRFDRIHRFFLTIPEFKAFDEVPLPTKYRKMLGQNADAECRNLYKHLIAV